MGNANGNGRAILVVDDHRDNLEIFATLAEIAGFTTVIRATSRNAALKTIAEWDGKPLAAAIVDGNLGDGPGEHIVRQIRQSHPSAVIFAVSADESNRAPMQLAGASDFFAKPVNVQELLALLESRAK